MMKFVFLILFVSFTHSIMSQVLGNVEEFAKYYHLIDKRKLIDNSIEKFINGNKDVWEEFGSSVDIEIRKTRLNWEQMRSDSSIVILTFMLKDIEDYTFNKDIYNFLEIDTLGTKIVYYDTKKNKLSMITSTDWWFNVYSSNKEGRNWINMMETIKKEGAEDWLASGFIFDDLRFCSTNDNILFLKENKIYVIRTKNSRIYELNNFVHKYFREKKFKERALMDRNSRLGLPVTYGN